jgi:hypothetical protein
MQRYQSQENGSCIKTTKTNENSSSQVVTEYTFASTMPHRHTAHITYEKLYSVLKFF